jgi:hypothetical protein
LAFSELPLPALRAEDVQLANAIRLDAPLVVWVLILARLSFALGAAERFGSAREWHVTRLPLANRSLNGLGTTVNTRQFPSLLS